MGAGIGRATCKAAVLSAIETAVALGKVSSGVFCNNPYQGCFRASVTMFGKVMPNNSPKPSYTYSQCKQLAAQRGEPFFALKAPTLNTTHTGVANCYTLSELPNVIEPNYMREVPPEQGKCGEIPSSKGGDSSAEIDADGFSLGSSNHIAVYRRFEDGSNDQSNEAAFSQSEFRESVPNGCLVKMKKPHDGVGSEWIGTWNQFGQTLPNPAEKAAARKALWGTGNFAQICERNTGPRTVGINDIGDYRVDHRPCASYKHETCIRFDDPPSHIKNRRLMYCKKHSVSCTDNPLLTEFPDFKNEYIQTTPAWYTRGSVESIAIRNTGISRFPPGLFDAEVASEWPELKSFRVEYNQITAIPATKGMMQGFTKVTYFSLAGNPIKEVPAGLFDRMVQMSTVSLSDTLLTSLPAALFKNNLKLIFVYLNAMPQLRFLPGNLFDGAPKSKLEEIDLQLNPKFEGFPAGLFNHCPALKQVVMRGSTSGKTIPKDIYSYSSKMRAGSTMQDTGLFLQGDVQSYPTLGSGAVTYVYDGSGVDYGWTLNCNNIPGIKGTVDYGNPMQAEYCACNPWHEKIVPSDLPLLLMPTAAVDDAAKLDKCEGDCESDDDCADGLKCFFGYSQSTGKDAPDAAGNAASPTPVPGCQQGGSGDHGDKHYCYEPKFKVVDDGQRIFCSETGSPAPFSCVDGHASYELCTPLPPVCSEGDSGGDDLADRCTEQGIVVNADYKDFVGLSVEIPASKFSHSADGKFTDDAEWSDAKPIRGAFANMYFDYDGTKMHVLADWIYNDRDDSNGGIADNDGQSACRSSLVDIFTRGGRDQWTFEVYPDSRGINVVHNSVRLNSTALVENGTVQGGATFGASTLQSAPQHMIVEVSFDAFDGNFGLEMSSPGPRFGCGVLEADKTKFLGILLGGNRGSTGNRNRRAAAKVPKDARIVVRPVLELAYSKVADNLAPPNGWCVMATTPPGARYSRISTQMRRQTAIGTGLRLKT